MMKKFFLLSVLALLAVTLTAQDKSVRVSPVCGPYLQNVTATSFTVMWISDKDSMAWVEVAPDDGTNFYYDERPKYYDLSGCGVNPIDKIHKVTVDGLEPGTSYRYRIMMKAVQNYFGQLDIVYGREYGAQVYGIKPPVATTLKTDYDEVDFAVVNDVHAQDSLFRRLFADKERNSKNDFILFNGDMTSDIDNESKIVNGYLKSACGLFAGETPLFMVRGNHEYRGKEAISYMDYYDFPDNKPYYAFKYGKFFFIVLDSGEDKPDSDIEYQEVLCTAPYLNNEAKWLKEVVESDDFKNAERRIVFSHIPPQIEDAWHGNCNMATLFLPVLNEAGIDVMFCGHNHEYSFRKAGSAGASFPVIVNDNAERMDVSLTANRISVKMFNPDGKETHSLSL